MRTASLLLSTLLLASPALAEPHTPKLVSKTLISIYVYDSDLDVKKGGDMNKQEDILHVLKANLMGPKDFVENGKEKRTYYVSCPLKWVASSRDGKQERFDIVDKQATPRSDVEPFNIWNYACEGKPRVLGR